MRLGSNNSSLHELIGSIALISVFAVAPMLFVAPAMAQSSDFASATAGADSDGAPVTSDDVAPPSSMDRPAPAADYDLPADAAAAPDSSASADAPGSSGTTASAADDRVLEIPRVINPSTYATRTAAAVARSMGLDDDSADELAADSAGATNDADNSSSQDAQAVPAQGANDAQAVAAEAVNDTQDYADQEDDSGGGPIVVNAAPVYVPAYVPPVAVNVAPPLPQPYVINNAQLPMYSALANRTLPIYSGLTPAPAAFGGGSRLLGPHLGQSFVMHNSVGGFGHSIGGFGHRR